MTNLDEKERRLVERLERIKALEEEIKKRENAVKSKESAKKQVLLRLSPSLWDKIATLAERDFRSINGEIEYLLSEAVKKFDK